MKGRLYLNEDNGWHSPDDYWDLYIYNYYYDVFDENEDFKTKPDGTIDIDFYSTCTSIKRTNKINAILGISDSKNTIASLLKTK